MSATGTGTGDGTTTVTDYLGEGFSGRVKIDGMGKEFERLFLVSGVTGDPDTILYNAATAFGLPDYGDVHPSISGTYVREITAEPMRGSNTKALVRIIYRPSSGGTPDPDPDSNDPMIELSGVTSDIMTDIDVDGTPISVDYTLTEAPSPPEYPYTDTRLVPVPIVSPNATLSVSRIESAFPLAKIRTYRGTTNHTNWCVDPDAPARTWLCRNISASSRDGGASYLVRYDFEYRNSPPTYNWDELVLWSNGGNPPADLVEGVGRKTVQVYPQANFNLLNLCTSGTGTGTGA